MRSALSFLAILIGITTAGCQPSVGATATGVVRFNGKPAPAGVMVTFQPQVPNSSASISVTDANGRFDLRFNARIRGVMPGESIVSLAIIAEPDASGTVSLPEALKGIRIPPAYGAKSELRKTVNAGTNVIDIDIDL
jgi:hypothetical protein